MTNTNMKKVLKYKYLGSKFLKMKNLVRNHPKQF